MSKKMRRAPMHWKGRGAQNEQAQRRGTSRNPSTRSPGETANKESCDQVRKTQKEVGGPDGGSENVPLFLCEGGKSQIVVTG